MLPSIHRSGRQTRRSSQRVAHLFRGGGHERISNSHTPQLKPWATPALIVSLIVSAYVMALGMGPGDHSWLGWISLLPLFIAVRWLAPWRACACGALWGGCLFLFSALAVATDVPPTIGSFLLLGCVPAVYALLGSWYSRWNRFDPLALGVGWIGVELALLPLDLQSGLLAGTQANGLLLGLVGNLLGYVFVGFVVAAAAASLLAVVSHARLRIPRDRPSAGLLQLARRFSSQTSLCIQLLPLHQASPRAPPIRPFSREAV